MKLVTAVFAILICFSGWSQGRFGVKEKDSCYFRYKTVLGDDGKEERVRLETKEQLRYTEWECGKTLGVIDCNSELTYDEGTNTVYKLTSDMSNLEGSNKPFTGTCESCHRNGRIERRVTFADGKENGTDTTYYESGCPQIVRTLIQGIDHGTWYYYYDSTGIPAWEMNYNLGEKHGKHIYFTKDGDTVKWENYDNGLLDGWKRTYHKNGVLEREIKYDHGVFNGPFRIYNNERVIIEELNYKDGKKDQSCTYYYDDGTLLSTESWSDGVKNGEFKMFYYDQQIQKSENYKKGLKEGWFEEFYPDNTAKNRSLYKKDVLIEEHRFDEQGRETYSFGTPTQSATIDDAMPTTTTKKEKKKKVKKEKKKKKDKE